MTKLPRLIFNTDGNWMLFYLPDRNPDDVTHQLDGLQTPDPWPTLHQCEVMVLGCDSA